MISINMIAARRAERLRLARITRALSMSALVAGALVVVTFAGMSANILKIRFEISRIEAELVRLQPTLDRIAALDRRLEQLRPRLAVLDNAQEATMRWSYVMEDLKHSIPPQTWLTGLAVERGADEAQTVRMNGITVSQKLVGEAMLRLNQNKLYRGVNLHFTQAGKIGERDTVEFELAAQLQPTEEQKNNEVAPSQAK
jgi:Tfp pilus assembly protein PilN